MQQGTGDRGFLGADALDLLQIVAALDRGGLPVLVQVGSDFRPDTRDRVLNVLDWRRVDVQGQGASRKDQDCKDGVLHDVGFRFEFFGFA